MSDLEQAPDRADGSARQLALKDPPLVAFDDGRIVERHLATYDATPPRGPVRRFFGFVFSLWPSLILFVILPALAVTFYYAFVAADQYVVKSSFVVRQVEDTSFSKGSAAFDAGQGGPEADTKTMSQGSNRQMYPSAGQGAGTGSRSSSITTDDQDGYVVASYIESRAIIAALSKTMDLEAIFRRPEADFWARLRARPTAEEMRAYWLDMVSTYADRDSGIVSVEVRAFRRDDALALAKAIVAAAGDLVNDMSLRARDEALARARQEVDRADRSMHAVMTEFETFRNGAGLIDPLNVASNTGDLLKQLLGQRIETDNELFVTLELRPDAPSIRALEARAAALDDRIAELRATLTAKDKAAGTIAATLVTYEELQVRQQLAQRIYVEARNAEEHARQTAARRWLYIAAFDPPERPDDAEYPDRIGFPAIAAAMLFVAWAIIALLRLSVADHVA
jgi:capsular polysaccharide transport system permease protein